AQCRFSGHPRPPPRAPAPVRDRSRPEQTTRSCAGERWQTSGTRAFRRLWNRAIVTAFRATISERQRRIWMSDSGQTFTDQVDYVSGRTRLFGIVGHPIEQVRSPEMFTAEFRRRGLDAILVPMHVLPDDFDALLPQLLRLSNLDGLIFTIPYKLRARDLADQLGGQARIVGAINALARDAGGWHGDIFDGIGCVEAFRRRGIALTGRRALLLGAGGAGSAIAVALASERPASLRLYDVDTTRAQALAATITRAFSDLAVSAGPPRLDDIDILLNATPAGM